ncbi:MAG TPA: TetR/AcrR family transcriptional regulator [Jatrophihabitans sp.]
MSTSVSSGDGRATRYAGQRERRRAEFVEAAISAIREHGPDASVQQIAEQAGVARTRIYRHFDDIADLQREIIGRACELLLIELAPVLQPGGTPRQKIRQAIGTYLSWLAEHEQLYRYTLRHVKHADSDDGKSDSDTGSYAAVRAAISVQVAALFNSYAAALRISVRFAEPLAFGLVGFMESAGDRWLNSPDRFTAAELADQLTEWAWMLISQTLRASGAELHPDQPLPAVRH